MIVQLLLIISNSKVAAYFSTITDEMALKNSKSLRIHLADTDGMAMVAQWPVVPLSRLNY